MSEEEKEREEYVKTYGQSVVNDVKDLLGPKVANHKELFISCVNKIFNRWIRGVYKSTSYRCYIVYILE